jgi:hypothetical protein
MSTFAWCGSRQDSIWPLDTRSIGSIIQEKRTETYTWHDDDLFSIHLRQVISLVQHAFLSDIGLVLGIVPVYIIKTGIEHRDQNQRLRVRFSMEWPAQFLPSQRLLVRLRLYRSLPVQEIPSLSRLVLSLLWETRHLRIYHPHRRPHQLPRLLQYQ